MSPAPSPAPLRLGIAGLGTVGIGVVKIIQTHADLLAARGVNGRSLAVGSMGGLAAARRIARAGRARVH